MPVIDEYPKDYPPNADPALLNYARSDGYTVPASPPAPTTLEPPVPKVVQPPAPKPKPKLPLYGHKFIFDVGHGLNNTKRGVYDPGACAAGWQEHKYVEAFVDDLAASVEALGGSVIIVEDLPLGARIAKNGADATSFHFNAGGGTGTEVWVPLLCSPASWRKSDRIGRAMAAALGLPYRGTKRSSRLSITNHGYERLIEVIFIDSGRDRAAFTARRRSAINAFINAV